uniref:Testicular haploid expressed gene protein-like n=1 Tax=Monodelphis domestica TaxID=13616 RepID=A0A5F8GLK9_MONDO
MHTRCRPNAKSDTRKPVRDLSTPKKVWGLPDRRLIWGNQVPIRPLTLCALSAKQTKRIDQLAEPKKVNKCYVPNRPEYHNSWGRGSIIWKLPSKAFFSYPSARIEKLSEPKRYKEEYLQKRPFSSPTWHVKDASQIPEASSRVVQLAVAKATHPEYEGPKQVETKIPPTALTTHPTTRVVTLSEPKIKIETLYFERRNNELPIRPVSNAAMSAQPSSRTQLLARAKTVNEQYLPVRPVKQPIRRSTLKYVPTTRIEELSVPNARTPLTTNGINLDAFKVKEAAKVAICSPRIVKLAEPVKR